MRSRTTEFLMLVAFVALVAGAASFGAMFRPGTWYAALAKPSWTPPNAVFGPVWTVLYLLIAIAGWLVWRTGRGRVAFAIWAVGLALNAVWSWLFFGRQAVGPALIDIVLLWCAIAGFMWAARKVSPMASLLFLPYLLWVSYATALNLAIWRLNA